MERQAVTVWLPSDLLEQVKRFQENCESFNGLVVEAVTREVQRRQALAAHQRIVARSAEVEMQTGVQPSSIALIHQLREAWRIAPTLLGAIFLAGCNVAGLNAGLMAAPSPEPVPEASLPQENPALVIAAPKAEATAAAEPWQSALNSGMSAALLAKHAVSYQDWELVATRWERAIASLEAIPPSAPNYADAQAKTNEYRQNQQVAQQRQQIRISAAPASPGASQPAASNSPTPSNSPAPGNSPAAPAPQGGSVSAPAASGSGAVSSRSPAAPDRSPRPTVAAAALNFCQSVQANPTGPSLQLSRIQFYRPPSTPFGFGSFMVDINPDKDYMIGCLTNNSRQPIIQVQIGYSRNTPGAGGFNYSSGSLSFPGEVIQPGATVPFRGPFGIDAGTSSLEIDGLAALNHRSELVNLVQQIQVPFRPTGAAPAAPQPFCTAGRSPQGNQPFSVSQIQLYRPPADPFDFAGQNRFYLVGCITNHGSQPLTDLNMTFSRGGAGLGFATVSLPGGAVPPGQTVHWRKAGDVEAGESPLTVEKISSNQGEITVEVTVSP